MYKVVLLPKAEKTFARADTPLARKLAKGFESLEIDPLRLFSSPDVYVWGGGTPTHFFSSAPLGAKPLVSPLKGLIGKTKAIIVFRPQA